MSIKVPSAQFKPGDRVCLKDPTVKPRWTPLSQATSAPYGTVKELKFCSGHQITEVKVLYLPDPYPWTFLPEELTLYKEPRVKKTIDLRLFHPGDKVVLSASAPRFGRFDVPKGEVGIIKSIQQAPTPYLHDPNKHSWTYFVIFPSYCNGKATLLVWQPDLSPAPQVLKFKPGDNVILISAHPRYGRGPVKIDEVGSITGSIIPTPEGYPCYEIDFPSHNHFIAMEGDLVPAPEEKPTESSPVLKVGDLVQVSPSVKTPKYGWGSSKMSHSSIGTIKNICCGLARVSFPDYDDLSEWMGMLDELVPATLPDEPSKSPESLTYLWRGKEVHVKVVQDQDGDYCLEITTPNGEIYHVESLRQTLITWYNDDMKKAKITAPDD